MAAFESSGAPVHLSWFKTHRELVEWTKEQLPPKLHTNRDDDGGCVHRWDIRRLYIKTFHLRVREAKALYGELIDEGLLREVKVETTRWLMSTLLCFVYLAIQMFSHDDSNSDPEATHKKYLCTEYCV